MISIIKKLLGLGPAINYSDLVKNGATILDVRSKGEYSSGNIKGSINISIDQLASNIHKLKDKANPIITCCASGARSESAKNLLKANGYTNVYNAGSWSSLQNKIR